MVGVDTETVCPICAANQCRAVLSEGISRQYGILIGSMTSSNQACQNPTIGSDLSVANLSNVYQQ